MRPSLRIAAIVAGLLAIAPLHDTLRAQPSDTSVVIGQRHFIHSYVLREDRPLLVHLPRSYGDARRRFPVVYLLDGEAHFASVSAMVDFLAQNGRVPEMIVVGIPNTKDRTHDLTPAADTGAMRIAMNDGVDAVSQRFPTAGGAALFRGFLTAELRRWVDTTYRTAPYRILVGHSFGGLFAIDALAADPRAFHAYVAISPSLWWDNGKYERRMEQTLARASLDGLALYMTTGGREPTESMIAPAQALGALLAARTDSFRTWYKVMPTETHGSNPLRTTYDALEQIFAGFETPDSVMAAANGRGDLAPLEAHHAMLTKRFGYPNPLTPDEVNQIAYFHLQQKHVDIALRLFRRNTEQVPDYANGWDSLADGLEADGKLADAVAAQERAVSVGERVKDPALPNYRAHLERLRKAAKR